MKDKLSLQHVSHISDFNIQYVFPFHRHSVLTLYTQVTVCFGPCDSEQCGPTPLEGQEGGGGCCWLGCGPGCSLAG